MLAAGHSGDGDDRRVSGNIYMIGSICNNVVNSRFGT